MSEEGQSQNIQDITQLQTLEQELLEKLQSAETPDAEKIQIINKIGELTQLRIQLYETLHRISDSTKQVAKESSQLVQQQLRSVELVEETLTRSKKALQQLQNERLGKLRVIEIQTYYTKMYQAHVRILKWVIAWIACLAICFSFYNRLTLFLAILLSIYFSGKIGYLILDTSNRSTQNFDQYDWQFNPQTAPSAVSSSSSVGETAASTDAKCTLF